MRRARHPAALCGDPATPTGAEEIDTFENVAGMWQDSSLEQILGITAECSVETAKSMKFLDGQNRRLRLAQFNGCGAGLTEAWKKRGGQEYLRAEREMRRGGT